MSAIALWWHMLIKGKTEQTLQAINSLYNLYDGMVVGVDDGTDSDEIANELSHYPNIYI